jgi:hypothetical protein
MRVSKKLRFNNMAVIIPKTYLNAHHAITVSHFKITSIRDAKDR